MVLSFLIPNAITYQIEFGDILAKFCLWPLMKLVPFKTFFSRLLPFSDWKYESVRSSQSAFNQAHKIISEHSVFFFFPKLWLNNNQRSKPQSSENIFMKLSATTNLKVLKSKTKVAHAMICIIIDEPAWQLDIHNEHFKQMTIITNTFIKPKVNLFFSSQFTCLSVFIIYINTDRFSW